jgi:hypothetical protein
VLTELTFRVAGRNNILCTFTKVNKGATIVITPLRAQAHGRIDRAMYTIQAPLVQARSFVEKHFEREYGPYKVVGERADAMTVEVSLRLPKVGPHDDPLHMALDVLGPDAFVLPLIVEDGFIHCSMVSASPEGTRIFLDLTKKVNEQLQPDTFHLLHVGPWKPTPGRPITKELTPRQQDVLRLAVALGYYNAPRESTLEGLAEVLGVSKAAVHKTLAAAENKVIREAVGAP